MSGGFWNLTAPGLPTDVRAQSGHYQRPNLHKALHSFRLLSKVYNIINVILKSRHTQNREKQTISFSEPAGFVVGQSIKRVLIVFDRPDVHHDLMRHFFCDGVQSHLSM